MSTLERHDTRAQTSSLAAEDLHFFLGLGLNDNGYENDITHADPSTTRGVSVDSGSNFVCVDIPGYTEMQIIRVKKTENACSRGPK